MVELAFSTADSYFATDYYYVYENGLNLLENLENYDREIHTTCRELEDIWFWKFETITGLRLEKLTLDFTDAFSVEGNFLGLQAAMSFHYFTYGMPELEIIAPTKELQEQLEDLFAAIQKLRLWGNEM